MNPHTFDEIFSAFSFYDLKIVIPRTSILGTYFKILGGTCLKVFLLQISREDKSEFKEQRRF